MKTEEDYLDILFGDGTDEEIEARLMDYLGNVPDDQVPDVLGPGVFATNPPEGATIDQADT